ncbi:MAG TPA: TauD/TfdA family dioxygenase [Candidatus Udaeobacter sp.]|nr:TauD/TfdA family dioxygenase [Candidatus Udaeobacter sp.]
MNSTRWLRDLTAAHLGEIDAALAAVQARGLAWHQITRENFPLAELAAALGEMARELEDGSGMVKLRGLPVGRYSGDALKQVWFGLGCHLGRPVYQNRRGELMREIRDEGAGIGARYGEVKNEAGGAFLSSYARTLSNGALRYHTDRTDVVGLLCVGQAASGGFSKLCSSAAVHNEILRRRPDLLALLYQPIVRSRFGEEASSPEATYPLPVFGVRNGKSTSHYSLTYIEAAQMVPGVAPLTPAQREAIAMLMDLAEELSFEMRLEPGDMQFLNNHVIYHGRTPFTDDPGKGTSRLLYRLWLSMPNSRALPVDHAVLWGNVEAGALRGGIGQTEGQA